MRRFVRTVPLPLLVVLATAAASAAPRQRVVGAVEELCDARDGFAEQGCGVKVNVELVIDGRKEKSFVVLRLHKKRAEDVLGLDRLWIQAFRNGTLLDFDLDGFRFTPQPEPTPFHSAGWVETANGGEEAPLPEEDHYLGPLRIEDGAAKRVPTALFRASRQEDETAWNALYDFFLEAIDRTLGKEGSLEYLEPGRAYCWNEDGSTTACD